MKYRISLDPPRGFRDILPPDSEQLTYLFHLFEEIASRHGYREVKPPTLERFEIFAIKAGEEIRNTMYVFKDKAGREVALRPEATASIARIYLKHLRHLPKPIRIYYIINCFRYEEPQYARYREFWQAGLELLGEPGIIADLEVLKILIDYYDKLGFTDHIELKIGSTGFYRRLFRKYGIEEEVQDRILHFMDKKMYEKALETIADGELRNILRKLWEEYRSDPSNAITYIEPIDRELVQPLEDLETVVDVLSKYKNGLRIVPDLAFARGLAYYTGIIFEVIVPGFPVSIAGGGRYDTLIKIYGGEEVPGTGFAIGVDRTLLALRYKGVEVPRYRDGRLKIAIILLADTRESYDYALKVLREASKEAVAVLFTTQKPSKLMPKILEQGFSRAIFIGKKEVESKTVTMKNLEKREQVTIPLNDLSYVLSKQ